MLLCLLASLDSVSLDPRQSPSGGALAQQLGALISLIRSASSAWRFLRLHVVRLVSAIMFMISIIVLISCISIFFLVVVVAMSGPILVKNWRQFVEIAFFAAKMRLHHHHLLLQG